MDRIQTLSVNVFDCKRLAAQLQMRTAGQKQSQQSNALRAFGSHCLFENVHCLSTCFQVPSPSIKADWTVYLKSSEWQFELDIMYSVAAAFQIRADDASAAALCAMCFHWDEPEDAVIAAVHYGGDTDTVASMVGKCRGCSQGALPVFLSS